MEKKEKNNQNQEFKGKNLEEAISHAEHILKLSRDEINYEIVAEKTKLFGIKRKEIVIRAGPKKKTEEDPATDFLEELLKYSHLELDYSMKKKNEITYLIFDGKDKRLLLRKDASLLLSIQHILNKIYPHKIQVDCDFYRQKKERRLKEYAQHVAQQVLETGRNEILEMMNPYERRIIHIAVNEVPGITSESIGEGFLKRIKIFPTPNQAK